VSRHRHARGSRRARIPNFRARLITRVVAVTMLGAAAGVVVAGWWGIAPGTAVGAACGWWWAKQPDARERARRRRLDADLPFAIDLVVSALRAGATPDGAARQVAEAVGGPVGDCLTRVQRALVLGSGAAEAWAHLGEGDTAARVARAAQRSGDSGAALAGSLARVAEDLRVDALSAADRRSRASAVLIVLPLGLCFLPAFVLTGLVPVVVAVVGDLFTPAP